MSKQSIIWLDHREVHIFELRVDSFIEVDAPRLGAHLKSATEARDASSTSDVMKREFAALADALRGADEILVVGPGPVKLQFLKYACAHDTELADKIVGLETVDNPGNRQIIVYARTYMLSGKRRA